MVNLFNKKIDKKRSIGLASKELGVDTHTLRFWEKEFPQIKPDIGKGGRRYYFDKDIQNIEKIKYFKAISSRSFFVLELFLSPTTREPQFTIFSPKRFAHSSKAGPSTFITSALMTRAVFSPSLKAIQVRYRGSR